MSVDLHRQQLATKECTQDGALATRGPLIREDRSEADCSYARRQHVHGWFSGQFVFPLALFIPEMILRNGNNNNKNNNKLVFSLNTMEPDVRCLIIVRA